MTQNISVRNKWFTLIEIVIGMLVIWVWLIAVITILQYATKLTNTTKSQVVAINLAREGIERIYNIRDTNWKMFASKKDQCRLASEPRANVTNCEQIPRITIDGLWFWWATSAWTYLSTMDPTSQYFSTWTYVLSWVNTELRIRTDNNNSWIESPDDLVFRMCLDTTTNIWDQCSNFTTGTPIFQTKYWRFWRGIEIKGLYTKDGSVGWAALTCTDWSGWCGNSNAKELRFCSKVDYIFDTVRSIELCTAMTNFLE